MTYEQARDYLLKKAAEMGLEVEVLAIESREFSLRARNGALEEITQATQGGIGIRAVLQGKAGYAYSEERSPEALDWILAESRDNALLQSGSGAFLPEGGALGQHDLLGEGLSASAEQKRETALGFEQTLRSDSRVKNVMFAGYQETETFATLGSSKGVSGAYRNGYASIGGSAVMQEGSSIKQGWDMSVAKEFHALDPGQTALDFIEQTGRLLGAKPLQTGRYPAYFESKPFAFLIAMMGNFLLSGKSVQEGKSLWAKQMGQRVASEHFTLLDDPTLPKGLASRPFDAEGTPAQRTVLIEQGLLKSFMHNSETAKALGMPNTGNAYRSYKGPLGVASTNMMVEPGSGLQMTRGVILTELMGLHAGVNPVSGDFSVQALGLWVEDGQVAYPVENFAVAGNFFEMLKNITALGQTLEWEVGFGIVGTPMVQVAELSFAGA